MSGTSDYRPGQQLTASGLASRAAAIAAASTSIDYAAGLTLASLGSGKALRDNAALPILGVLHGSASPYAFAQAVDLGANAMGAGARAGTAYEANGVAGLDGKVARLYPDRSGNYRFQWVGRASSASGTACGQTIFLVDCNGDPISGATIALNSFTGSLPTPVTIGTTDGSGSYTFTVGTFEFLIIVDGFTGFGYTNGFQLYYCDGANSATYCYSKTQATVSYNAPCMIVPSAILFNNGSTAGWTTVDDPGSGTANYTFQSIGICPAVSLFPATAFFQAFPTDPTTFLNNCVNATLTCLGDTDVSLTMFDYTDFVFVGGSCDLGCATFGAGPNFRGVQPKVLQVAWTASNPATGADLSAIVFGTLGGEFVTVTWNGTTWISDCVEFTTTILEGYTAPITLFARVFALLGGGAVILAFATAAQCEDFAGSQAVFTFEAGGGECSNCAPVDDAVGTTEIDIALSVTATVREST
jgi:hypothetical protein